MDTRNNYSLANTNGFMLLKDVVFFFMEKFGESFGSIYDTLTLDTSQAVKRQIDNSVTSGHLGQILKVIQEIFKETKYLFNTPTSSSSSSNTATNNNSSTNNQFNTLPKSFSSPNFYSTQCNSEENISLSSTPNGSSIYSTPGNSTFLSSQANSFDSSNSTPNGSNSPNSSDLSADQIKIKQLELELLKFKEAAAAMMNLKQMANINNNNTLSPSKSAPPPVASAPPPPPPPPPVFKQPTPINLKRGQSSPNLSSGGATQPPQFNIQEILSKKPLLKKVNLDKSPGGTPLKDRPKSGVEDVFKAILHKFKNENNQSPCKGQTDDESSDSDFE